MAFSFVLDSTKSSTYPMGYASGFLSPAALLRNHFEHPPSITQPGPSSSATFCAAKTFAPAEMPTRSPSFFASNFAV
ncbi:MAG: hypothetical protein K0S45_4630 [Nitrospira sp.]|nr:hypothetical protein [Nitrospira sp.]